MIVSAALANNTARIATASLSRVRLRRGFPSRVHEVKNSLEGAEGDDELVVSGEWEHPWATALSSASLGVDPQS